MKKLLLLIALFIIGFTVNAQITPTSGIVYVKKGATGNGSNWQNAAGEFADAKKVAKTNTAITQIWVAGGRNIPLYSPGDNNFGKADGVNNTFLLVKNVKIYGGFAGTQTTLAVRNLALMTNKSSLDGANNFYHVVLSSGDVESALLDGFTITGSNANGTNRISVNRSYINLNSGSGIYNASFSPVLTNVVISSNSSIYGGGVNNESASSPELTNVIISGINGNGRYFASIPFLKTRSIFYEI